MDNPETTETYEEPANLRFLRRLVTVLMIVMICGVLVIIGLFVTRLNSLSTPIALPDTLTLPDGTTATAFTQGDDWYAIVTKDNEILIYDRTSNTLRQTITLN